MTIKDRITGRELTFELLSNGILKAYDYACAWDVTFKKVDDKWEGHLHGGLWGYRGILRRLNELQAEKNLFDKIQKLA
jgi:hypothetical protein